MKKKLIFLLPVLNEVSSIKSVYDEINSIDIKFDYDIVIVDGGSTDGSIQLCKELGIRVLKSKKGYGRQYMYAFFKINSDYIITGDCDTTYPFKEAYCYLIKYVENEKYQFITTNRFKKLDINSMGYMRFVGNKILTLFANLLFGLKLKDSQSGMWIFEKSVLNKLNLTDDDMAFSQEIKIEAFTKLKKCREVPISYSKRKGSSKLSFLHAFKNFIFLFKKKFL